MYLAGAHKRGAGAHPAVPPGADPDDVYAENKSVTLGVAGGGDPPCRFEGVAAPRAARIATGAGETRRQLRAELVRAAASLLCDVMALSWCVTSP